MGGKDGLFEKLEIDGDLVTHFFDSVNKMSDSAVY